MVEVKVEVEVKVKVKVEVEGVEVVEKVECAWVIGDSTFHVLRVTSYVLNVEP